MTIGDNMVKKSRISARVDENVKRKAENIFEQMGLSTSSAISLFLNQVVSEQGFPFRPRLVPNKKTRDAMQRAQEGKTQVFSNENEMFEKLGLE